MDRRARILRRMRLGRPRDRLVAAVALALALLFSASTPNEYLNRVAFLDPYVRVRAWTKTLGALDPRIKLVVMDDSSVARLGRMPTLADWIAVADRLFEQGYERALLFDVLSLDAELGALPERSAPGRIVAGAVVSLAGANARTRKIGDIPARLFERGGGWSGSEPGQHVYAAHPEALGLLDGLGHLNLLGGGRARIAYGGGGANILPFIPLAARPDGAPLPAAYDGNVRVRLADVASVYGAAVPGAAFFDKNGAVRAGLSAGVKKAVAGGKVALLVPEGFTGSRFVETPLGDLQTYVVLASFVDGALNGRYQAAPLDPRAIVLAALAAMLVITRGRRPRRVLAATAAVAGVAAVAAVAALAVAGAELPLAPVLVVTLALYGVRAGADVWQTAREKWALRAELELGRVVQEVILPQEQALAVAGWDLRVVFRPYGQMSGDWFQLFSAPAGRGAPFAVAVIGDVVGKGPSAALVTALIAGVWNDWRERWEPTEAAIGAFAAALDRAIAETMRGTQNTTMSLALLTEDAAYLTAIGAPRWGRVMVGPAAAQGSGPRSEAPAAPGQHGETSASAPTMELVRAPGQDPLGLRSGRARSPVRKTAVVRVTPAEGDLLVAFTDGVIDGVGPARAFLGKLAESPAARGRGDALFAEVEAQARVAGTGALPDDFTMLIIQRVAPVAVSPPVDLIGPEKAS